MIPLEIVLEHIFRFPGIEPRWLWGASRPIDEPEHPQRAEGGGGVSRWVRSNLQCILEYYCNKKDKLTWKLLNWPKMYLRLEGGRINHENLDLWLDFLPLMWGLSGTPCCEMWLGLVLSLSGDLKAETWVSKVCDKWPGYTLLVYCIVIPKVNAPPPPSLFMWRPKQTEPFSSYS